MIVYLIWTGEYSDANVRAVCSTPESAEIALCLYSDGDNAHIEEMEMDECLRYPKGQKNWYVSMDRDGNVLHYWITDPEDQETHGFGSTNNLWVRTWARDKDHAIKIAGELRTRLIANNEWPTEGKLGV